jgi:hypothetical protein
MLLIVTIPCLLQVLAGLAAGTWLVSTDYLNECQKAGKWLPEVVLFSACLLYFACCMSFRSLHLAMSCRRGCPAWT